LSGLIVVAAAMQAFPAEPDVTKEEPAAQSNAFDRLTAMVPLPEMNLMPSLGWLTPTNLLAPHFYINPEFRSAAPSRGKMDDDRPHMYLYATAVVDTPSAGSFGMGYWSDTALTKRLSSRHRRLLYENDAIPFYRYKWNFNNEWSLQTDAILDLKYFSGYKDEYRFGWHYFTDAAFYGRLDNPYIVPYTLIRRMLHPDSRFDFRLGALRTFRLPWNLTLTPGLYSDGGSEEQVRRRYGPRPDGSSYRPGFNAITTFIRIARPISRHISIYAGIEQFDIVRDAARRAEKRRKSPEARRDITIAVFGITAWF